MADAPAADVGVLILAGGEATRLPGKLERAAGARPLIARVYANVSPGRPTYLSGARTFPVEIDRFLACPMVIDRWPNRGPLGGLVSTMAVMRSRYVFAVAGDAPFVTAAFIDRLCDELGPGVEAVVPKHARGVEPLAAIYDRQAFLAVALPQLEAGDGALRHVIERLATIYVTLDVAERVFTNVNTPADYTRLDEVLR